MSMVRVYDHRGLIGVLPRLGAFRTQHGAQVLGLDPTWLAVLSEGLGQTPYCITCEERGQVLGYLPLASIRSRLFGRFLVSLPYLNTGGVIAVERSIEWQLIDRAIALAEELDVRYLELRQEQPSTHPALTERLVNKLQLRRGLPGSTDALWRQLDPKVRNQVRKGQKSGLEVVWGGLDCLPEFYAVFSQNMRDLGTPVYGRRLFRSLLERFPGSAELCVVRSEARPVASGLLLHGASITEVPSAGSLRSHRALGSNMLMYWHLLQRAVERGQAEFDFGRSTPGSGTHAFKTQWGAIGTPAHWQYYVRGGEVAQMRPDHPRYQRWIGLWQHLPLVLTQWLGPPIVAGIP